jgi:lysylphosphatidylglycerol synthetase-like protein (DUF2156 family)
VQINTTGWTAWIEWNQVKDVCHTLSQVVYAVVKLAKHNTTLDLARLDAVVIAMPPESEWQRVFYSWKCVGCDHPTLPTISLVYAPPSDNLPAYRVTIHQEPSKLNRYWYSPSFHIIWLIIAILNGLVVACALGTMAYVIVRADTQITLSSAVFLLGVFIAVENCFTMIKDPATFVYFLSRSMLKASISLNFCCMGLLWLSHVAKRPDVHIHVKSLLSVTTMVLVLEFCMDQWSISHLNLGVHVEWRWVFKIFTLYYVLVVVACLLYTLHAQSTCTWRAALWMYGLCMVLNHVMTQVPFYKPYAIVSNGVSWCCSLVFCAISLYVHVVQTHKGGK